MNASVKEYINLYFLLKFDNNFYKDSSIVDKLDILWSSFSEEEINLIEKSLEKNSVDAPQSLDLVDVPTKLGTNTFPRKNIND